MALLGGSPPGRPHVGVGGQRGHHGSSDRCGRRQIGDRGQRSAQAASVPDRKRMRGRIRVRSRRGALLRDRGALQRWTALPLQVQALQRRATGVRAGKPDRGLWRESRQLQFSALVPRHDSDAGLRERRTGQHAALSRVARGGCERRRSGLCLRTPRRHRSAADRFRPQVAARRRHPLVAVALLGTARPVRSIHDHRRRARAAGQIDPAGGSTAAAGSSAWPSTATSTRSRAATGSTRP